MLLEWRGLHLRQKSNRCSRYCRITLSLSLTSTSLVTIQEISLSFLSNPQLKDQTTPMHLFYLNKRSNLTLVITVHFIHPSWAAACVTTVLQPEISHMNSASEAPGSQDSASTLIFKCQTVQRIDVSVRRLTFLRRREGVMRARGKSKEVNWP